MTPRPTSRRPAWVALLAVAWVVAACGGGGDGGSGAAATVTAAPETVTVTVAASTAPPPTASSDAAAPAPPTPDDQRAIAAAVADIVVQCQSVAAGYVDHPERDTLEHAVDALVGLHGRVAPDASFTVTGATDLDADTTLQQELDLAARHLRDGCAADLADRLDAGQ